LSKSHQKHRAYHVNQDVLLLQTTPRVAKADNGRKSKALVFYLSNRQEWESAVFQEGISFFLWMKLKFDPKYHTLHKARCHSMKNT